MGLRPAIHAPWRTPTVLLVNVQLPLRLPTCAWTVVIDLHCHILPGIDDGAGDLSVSLAMARAQVADGVTVVACTPHILPGLYHNTGPQIRKAVQDLQEEVDAHDIPLQLTTGADVHITPDIVAGLRSGHLLSVADSRYVLVEPPHHVAPLRLSEPFFELIMAGYVPVLTHPERLGWIKTHYAAIQALARAGTWMQVTAGSLAGGFGKTAQYWAERMLDEGLVHILATDAHDTRRRPPNLSRGHEIAAKRVGEAEAQHLVVTRPLGIVNDQLPSSLPMPALAVASSEVAYVPARSRTNARPGRVDSDAADGGGGLAERLRRLFK
jgi:protein-tyrosine phosphatase